MKIKSFFRFWIGISQICYTKTLFPANVEVLGHFARQPDATDRRRAAKLPRSSGNMTQTQFAFAR